MTLTAREANIQVADRDLFVIKSLFWTQKRPHLHWARRPISKL